MKKFTAQEIATYLANNNTFEWEHGQALYYLHYKDGELVPSLRSADFSTCARDPFLEDLWQRCVDSAKAECDDDDIAFEIAMSKFDGPGGAWDTEAADSPQLLAVAQDLADQLNDYSMACNH